MWDIEIRTLDSLVNININVVFVCVLFPLCPTNVNHTSPHKSGKTRIVSKNFAKVYQKLQKENFTLFIVKH